MTNANAPDASNLDIERELAARGGVLRGHFQLASGRHADTYIEKFRILQWPDLTSACCQLIADHFRGRTNVVAGPTTGGVILSFETARLLGTRSLIAERPDEPGKGGRVFKRGFELGPGDRVLIVDDVLTTGGSVQDVVDAVRARGAQVVGIGLLVDRSGRRVDFGAPQFACLSLDIATWAPDECPLCPPRGDVPLTIT